MKLKLLLGGLIAAAAVATSHAQQTTFTGYTNGQFNGPALPNSGAQMASLTGPNGSSVNFFNNNFNTMSVGGVAVFGGNPSTVAGSTRTNFGTISVVGPSTGTASFSGNTFSLLITFTAPPGAGSQLFSAVVSGTVDSMNGGVQFTLNSPTTRTFVGASGSTYTLTLDSQLFVATGNAGAFGGTISTQVPEGGATVALLGMSFVGLAAVRRKIGAR